jgi:hypothetical protein
LRDNPEVLASVAVWRRGKHACQHTWHSSDCRWCKPAVNDSPANTALGKYDFDCECIEGWYRAFPDSRLRLHLVLWKPTVVKRLWWCLSVLVAWPWLICYCQLSAYWRLLSMGDHIALVTVLAWFAVRKIWTCAFTHAA